MRYVICTGNKSLKYYTSFASVEDACSFLINDTKCRLFNCCKVRSIILDNWYSIILYIEGISKGIDFMIYGIKDYEEKEKI